MFRAGDRGLTYLAYGTRDPGDVCYYPRSNKIAFRGVGVIARLEQLTTGTARTDPSASGRRGYLEGVPELPEVETIRRQLAPHLEGRTIVDARDPRSALDAARAARRRRGAAARRGRGARGPIGQVPGLGAVAATRYLLAHLRMTGALLFDPDARADPHARAARARPAATGCSTSTLAASAPAT